MLLWPVKDTLMGSRQDLIKDVGKSASIPSWGLEPPTWTSDRAGYASDSGLPSVFVKRGPNQIKANFPGPGHQCPLGHLPGVCSARGTAGSELETTQTLQLCLGPTCLPPPMFPVPFFRHFLVLIFRNTPCLISVSILCHLVKICMLDHFLDYFIWPDRT